MIDLLNEHKFVGAVALAIWAIVRALKEGKFADVIKPNYRPAVAVGLGLLAGALDSVATGAGLQVALVNGFHAALAAIAGHELIVHGIVEQKQ